MHVAAASYDDAEQRLDTLVAAIGGSDATVDGELVEEGELDTPFGRAHLAMKTLKRALGEACLMKTT
ncbi:hypothetical protein [Synechococcus phage Yong-L2-223]|nr:hypothetical protein [Synechococcus phage Yong-L2-223]